ncbi:MAG: DUF4254 domain-containing protein [Pirellulaceae bacterium]
MHDIASLQRSAIARWHRRGLDNPFSGFCRIICHQCSLNYLLWHEEDAARSPLASDGEIAQIKRTIDHLNQQRNDYVERLDGWIGEWLEAQRIVPRPDATLNTETPGSAIDRLAIMGLRIYHLCEQLQRSDVDSMHLEVVHARLSICRQQHAELCSALTQLVEEIVSGKKQHRLCRQLKMYNEPNLNPYLYSAPKAAATDSAPRVDQPNRLHPTR